MASSDDIFWFALGMTNQIDNVKHYNRDAPVDIKADPGWIVNRYLSLVGYNRSRQLHLERMYRRDKPLFERVLGHPIVDTGVFTMENSVIEIASREGWKYYSVGELSYDPVYRNLCGITDPPLIEVYRDRYKFKQLAPREPTEQLLSQGRDSKRKRDVHRIICASLVIFSLILVLIGASDYNMFPAHIIGLFGLGATFIYWLAIPYFVFSKLDVGDEFETYFADSFQEGRRSCPKCGSGVDSFEFKKYPDATRFESYIMFAQGQEFYQPCICKKCGAQLLWHYRDVFRSIMLRSAHKFIEVIEDDNRFDGQIG